LRGGVLSPREVGPYTTGQLFLEEHYTLAVLAHAGIRTNHLDGNTRLCTATAAEALKETFGSDGQPGSYEDIDHADTLHWEMLAQAAQATRDQGLLELVSACHPQTLRQMRWTNPMIKVLSPQLLVSV
jgi:hypothetical protein